MTPEIQSRIAVFRAKANEGTLTIDEMKEAIVMIREGRRGAAVASEQSRRVRAKKEIKSADELLGELEDI